MKASAPEKQCKRTGLKCFGFFGQTSISVKGQKISEAQLVQKQDNFSVRFIKEIRTWYSASEMCRPLREIYKRFHPRFTKITKITTDDLGFLAMNTNILV